MRRGDLQHPGAELHLDMVVANDGNAALGFRQLRGQGAEGEFADEGGVAGILGVHGDGGVTWNGFRAGGGDGEELILFPGHGHLEVVEVALLLLHDDFFVRKCGAGNGAPVNHPAAAVDEAFLVEIDKDLLDAGGIGGIHGEAFPGPVTGGAEFLELLDNDAAVLFFPLPDLLEKFVPTEVIAVLDLALFLERAFHDGLGGDAGMIRAGKPKNFQAHQAGAAGENVLQGVVENVTEGEDARDVGGWDDNRKGRLG